MEIDYGKIFCEATSVIVKKELEGLAYDVTRTCIITDDSYKKIGRYTVQENNLKYEAYSLNTNFTIGDNVLVLIPRGDYNLQKTIINKIVNDADLASSASYISPLKQMLNFTDNIIEKDNIAPDANSGVQNGKYFSLLANEETKNNIEQLTYKLLYSIDWTNYNNYDRLGISADFQNQLKNLGTLSGDYGLEFLFFGADSTLADQQDKKNAVYSTTFNISDILGNPYNFPVYFTQEKVIDIANLSDIKTLNIYFYQKGNFKNEFNEYIISEDPSIYGNKLKDNIFIGNIKLFLGYSTNEFSKSQLFLSTPNDYNYSRFMKDNTKQLSLSFVHKIDDNNYEIINNPNDSEQEMEVYWVRYNGNNTDQAIEDIVGEHWTTSAAEFNMKMENGFSSELFINKENGLAIDIDVRVKAVCRIRDENGYWTKYESNILNFLSVDPVVDETTYNRIKGLTIQCLDNSYGYYFLYNQNNEILDESKSIRYDRKLQIQYDGYPIATDECDDTFDADNIKTLTWKLPFDGDDEETYTMLVFTQSSINNGKSAAAGYGQVQFKEKSDIENFSEIIYNIKKEWYVIASNNTVTCQIELKNGEKYTATTELVFGKADSQGGNYRLNIDYEESNRNSFEIVTIKNNNNVDDEQPNSTVVLKAILQDKTGRAITNIENTWKWNWSFYPGDNKKYYPEKNDNSNYFSLTEATSNSAKLSFIVNSASDLSEKLCLVIKLSLEINNETIISYFPVSIKIINKGNPNGAPVRMAGARKIIYNSLGTPNYDTNPYILYDSNTEIEDIKWTYNINSNDISGYPTLSSNSEGKKALKASPVYITKEYESCIVAKDSKGIIYWIQPIVIIQSEHDLISSSDWNGEATVTDDAKIISAQVAAGKMVLDEKDKINKFSGILMGTMNVDEGDITGLLGISKGIRTFTLSDNGSASFGDENNVAVNFGNEDNSITNHNNNFTIEIDEGTIGNANIENSKIKNSNFSTEDTSKNLTFKIENGILTTTKKININNNYYLNGTDYLLSIGNLKINSSGEVYYGSKTLANYIKDLVDDAVENATS